MIRPDIPAHQHRHAACGGCRNRGPACDDCVLRAVIDLDGAPGTLLPFDDDERAAIAALAGQGLLPPLRLAPLQAA